MSRLGLLFGLFGISVGLYYVHDAIKSAKQLNKTIDNFNKRVSEDLEKIKRELA